MSELVLEPMHDSKGVAQPAAPLHSKARQKPLGQRLIDAGFLTEAQLELALLEKERHGGYLGEVLVKLGFVTDDILTNNLAAETQTVVIDIEHAVVDQDVLKLVSYETASRYKVIPLVIQGDRLMMAMADAFNIIAIDALEKSTGMTLDVVSAPESDVIESIERHYSQGATIDDTVERLMQTGIAPTEEEGAKGESPMVRLVEQIIALGLKQRATHIHFEPEEKPLRVRMRVDGILRQEVLLPSDLRPALTARIKLISNVNVTEKRVPQDGRIRFVYGNREVDLRVSTLPTNHGESIVMRILESSENRPTFHELGLSENDSEKLLGVLNQPFGMVLVTGPTGSGKTTTLYSALGQIDAVQRSIFTLEDPIEYSMPKIRQTPIRNDVGVTFASGLKALLRQDPDVILVGEIRDQETAQLATRASLTGHLVLSTLHTNDAVGTIPRLIDMGLEPYLLPASLTGIIAQRLLRKICGDCKEPLPDAHSILDKLGLSHSIPENTEFWQGKGCQSCKGSGYRGRQAIYEVLIVDEDFHEPIISGANSAELTKLARQKGMRSMLEDGLDKAAQGITTIDEVLRVVR
ncbi:MAG: GspE/PulE family protein [Gammaproteobacteria bacterium]